jgi:hypothetical protein
MHKPLILLALLAAVAAAPYALPAAAEQARGCPAPATSGSWIADDGTLPPSAQTDKSSSAVGATSGCRLSIAGLPDDDSDGFDGEDGE